MYVMVWSWIFLTKSPGNCLLFKLQPISRKAISIRTMTSAVGHVNIPQQYCTVIFRIRRYNTVEFLSQIQILRLSLSHSLPMRQVNCEGNKIFQIKICYKWWRETSLGGWKHGKVLQETDWTSFSSSSFTFSKVRMSCDLVSILSFPRNSNRSQLRRPVDIGP